ncbi:acyl carrier protein-like protein [Coniella lustricola]|uniref:Acyl carrier protein n=1 Tax=Coniella lustricola TaxID=2025994 RepID=A0A2T3AAD8_9PEZI|nr:acyl carrier protein-like protein [Coniella lustricola]
MFRTAALRTASLAAVRRVVAVAPAASARSFSAVSRRVAVPQVAVAAWKVGAIRTYAAGAGLAKTDVEGRIISILSGFDKVNDASNITPTAHFANDLGLDSLDTVEVVMAIEEEFSIEIPDKDADAIHSVDKAVEYILSQPDAH